MSNLFNTYLYNPLLSSLIFLYENIPGHDLGIAIIALTVVIRIVLLPLFYKGAKDQAILQRLAPKIKEIQKDHKDDRAKQAQVMMELYREHKVNPLSQFLIIIIQLPVLIALYWVFLKGIPANGELNHYFLGIIDLSSRSLIIVALAALAQYFQGKLALPKTSKNGGELSPMEKMGRQMIFIGPVLTVMFLSYLPSAVGLYWLTTSIFSVIQQIVINKRLNINPSPFKDKELKKQ
ncbi:MAG: YidC/Oxa1 family membrane protein insertase [Patescibacteria group bacterium]